MNYDINFTIKAGAGQITFPIYRVPVSGGVEPLEPSEIENLMVSIDKQVLEASQSGVNVTAAYSDVAEGKHVVAVSGSLNNASFYLLYGVRAEELGVPAEVTAPNAYVSLEPTGEGTIEQQLQALRERMTAAEGDIDDLEAAVLGITTNYATKAEMQETLGEILAAIQALPDGQAVSAQVALNTAAIEALQGEVNQLGQKLSDFTAKNITKTYTDLFFSDSQTTIATGEVGYKVYYLAVPGAGKYRITASANASKPIFNVGFASSTPAVGVSVSNIQEWSAASAVDGVYEVSGAGYILICLYYTYTPGTDLFAYLISDRLNRMDNDIATLQGEVAAIPDFIGNIYDNLISYNNVVVSDSNRFIINERTGYYGKDFLVLVTNTTGKTLHCRYYTGGSYTSKDIATGTNEARLRFTFADDIDKLFFFFDSGITLNGTLRLKMYCKNFIQVGENVNNIERIDQCLPEQVYENLLRFKSKAWDSTGNFVDDTRFDCSGLVRISDIPGVADDGIVLLSGRTSNGGISAMPSVVFFDRYGGYISSLSSAYNGGSSISPVDIPSNSEFVAFNKAVGGEYSGLSIKGFVINDLHEELAGVESVAGWSGEYDIPVTASGIKYFLYKYFKAGQQLRIIISGSDEILINGNMSVVFKSGSSVGIKTKAGVYNLTAPADTNQICFVAYAAAVGDTGTIHAKVEIVGSGKQPTFPKITGPLVTIIDDDTLDPTSVALFHDSCEALGIKGTFACLTKSFENYNTLKDLLKGYEREGYNIVTHAYSQVNAFRSQKKLRFTVSGVTTASIGAEYTYIDEDGNTSQATLLDGRSIEGGSGWVDLVFYDNMKVPQSQSGTLTKTSGNGDATIAYSAWVEGVFRDIDVATDQLVHGMQDLQEAGFVDYRHWVTPYGAHDEELQRLAQKVGLDCLVSIANNSIVRKDAQANRYFIPRYGLNPDSNVATLKSKIDNAVANNGWILLGTHFYNGWTAQEISDVFDVVVNYALAAGCRFVTLGEGVRIYNPVFDYNETY